MKSFLVGFSGVIAVIYLLNPTAGVIEFIPDWIPVVGNLDEVGAVAVAVAALAYFGIDVTKIFKRTEKKKGKK